MAFFLPCVVKSKLKKNPRALLDFNPEKRFWIEVFLETALFFEQEIPKEGIFCTIERNKDADSIFKCINSSIVMLLNRLA